MRKLHSWNLTPRQAINLQLRLKKKILRAQNTSLEGNPSPEAERLPRIVAGADCAIGPGGDEICAAVVLFSFPGLKEIEKQYARLPLSFPYIPGLLSFRECPVLLKAFANLKHEPDVIFFDGQGYAHPRRMGLACHMGLWLDKPSIGCAKSVLVGDYDEPGEKMGSSTPLKDGRQVLGSAVRTRDGCKPVFVSVGYKITLREAVRLTLDCCDGFRIPRPTRVADKAVGLITK